MHSSGAQGVMTHPSLSFRRRWTSSSGVAVFLMMFVLSLLAVDLHAQSIQGSILGTITDKADAVVPQATVTLTNLDENTTRTAVSNGSGNYQFIDVKAGHYTVEVSVAGFEKWSVTGVVLAARQQLRLDASLVVGSIQEEVKVSGDAISAINTDTPSIGAVYSAADAANLPVNTRASASGTSALNIVGTLPGVQTDGGGSKGQLSFAVQGGLPF